jgi:hypothetical protein
MLGRGNNGAAIRSTQRTDAGHESETGFGNDSTRESGNGGSEEQWPLLPDGNHSAHDEQFEHQDGHLFFEKHAPELRFQASDREGMAFDRDLGFDLVPWIDPIQDLGVVAKFETQLFAGSICNDIRFVYDVERVQTVGILGHMKLPLDL